MLPLELVWKKQTILFYLCSALPSMYIYFSLPVNVIHVLAISRFSLLLQRFQPTSDSTYLQNFFWPWNCRAVFSRMKDSVWPSCAFLKQNGRWLRIKGRLIYQPCLSTLSLALEDPLPIHSICLIPMILPILIDREKEGVHISNMMTLDWNVN